MPSTIGSRIRRRRKEADLTIAELAQRTGINSSQLSKMENSRFDLPSVGRVVAICRVLNAPLDEVILGQADAYRERVRMHNAAIEAAAKEMAGEL